MDFHHDTGKAQAAVTAARRRKLPVPEAITDTHAMWSVVVQAGHDPHPDKPTADHIPATPEELDALITERAHALRIADYRRKAASAYQEPVARRYNQLVRDAVPGWIASLTPEFNGAIKAVRASARKLPEDLRTEHLNWNDPVLSAAWERAQGAAAQLDQLVNDRLIMARAIGTDTGHDNKLYAVAAFPEPDLDQVMADHWLNELSPIAKTWKELAGQPVARWVTLARAEAHGVKLVLAVPDEVRQRADTVARWQAGSFQLKTSSTLGSARTAVQQAIRPQAA